MSKFLTRIPSVLFRPFVAIAVVALTASGISVLVASSTAIATGSNAAITVGATSARVGQANNLDISLSGFSADEQNATYQVTLKYVDANNVDQTNGVLSATQGSTSLISGYSSYSAAKLGFKGTYAAIAQALSTVTWTPSAASSGLSLRIGLATAPGTNQFYDANSGHYYEYVSSGLSWTAAKTAASNKTLNGLVGYLAHITTVAENNFVANEATAPSVWIGATDAAVEGQWRWAGATIAGESDFVFGTYSTNQSSTNSATPSSWASGWGLNAWYPNSSRVAGWASGEPNNWSGVEDCAVTNWSGGSGSWNDLNCADQNAYLVEFGGAGGTLTALSLTLDASMGASNALATWTSPSSPSTALTQSYDLSFNYDVTGITSSDFVNTGTATGCTISPSASSATSGTPITVTASGCSAGTVELKLLENSVTVAGGLVLPASTASTVIVSALSPTVNDSTVTLSHTALLIPASAITVTVLPKDSNQRLLGPGKTVTIASSLGSVSAVTDNQDGTYSATITPGNTAGVSAVTVTAEGVTISSGLSFQLVSPATWASPSSPNTSASQIFSLTFTDTVSGISSADFVNMGTATGCSFTPAFSTATTGAALSITASGCSVGTVQPKLLASSVILASGLSLPAATASAVTIQNGPASLNNSTVSLSRTSVISGNSTIITITITPIDSAGRNLGPGINISVSSGLGTVSAVTDNGDGTYTASITPGDVVGTSDVTVVADGSTITSGLQFAVTEIAAASSTGTPSVTSTANRTPLINTPATTPTVTLSPSANIADTTKPITTVTGELPVAVQGKLVVLVNGVVQNVSFEILNDQKYKGVTEDGLVFEVEAQSSTGAPLTLKEDGALIVTPGQSLAIQGTGFLPNSEVTVWLFSTPKLLGGITVNADGTVSGDVAIDLGLPAGKHSLQVTGTHPDGTPRSFMVSVFVPEDNSATTRIETPASSDNPAVLWTTLSIFAVVAVLTFIIVVLIRRRKKS